MKRIYIEKKVGFDTLRQLLQHELETLLGKKIPAFRLLHLYYREEAFDPEEIEQVFSEPLLDDVLFSISPESYDLALRIEYIPGMFDQRAYWANACLEVLGKFQGVSCGICYLFSGIEAGDAELIRKHLINPVESREVPWEEEGHSVLREEEDLSWMEPDYSLSTAEFIDRYRLAMSEEDLEFIKEYFKGNERLPNWTELKMIDTYWSDHCRHTTFLTEIVDVNFENYNIPAAKDYLEKYLSERSELTSKPMSLMDLATISARRYMKRSDSDIEHSAEINACSIRREIAGKEHLILFKNETHNHPTEIEPFGGAATCLGGAIRDPLSARAWVYQSMRITGAADPRKSHDLPGKLPQRTITRKAAQGFSSYGNQIGLCTGHVKEYYHPGFLAKRLEAGFVIASAKTSHVVRKEPAPGDLLLLVGGPTGRDGIGGASGSSRSHTETVVQQSGSEVQKGNAPEERKLQRFFRRGEIGPRIKRCNDFGAGGISVAFGELADGLEVHLDRVPVKYRDIHPWELAISESQERMALVIDPLHLSIFQQSAAEENLSCTVVGTVNESPRFKLYYDGRIVADLEREFLNCSGAPRKIKLEALPVDWENPPEEMEEDLLFASQRGLVEQFDSSIGRVNVLNPYGGERLSSFVEGMVALVPTPGNVRDVSIVSHGYDPYLSSWSPYHGGEYAVMASIAKNLVLGGDIEGLRFTFQEYFQRLGEDATQWGKPFLALLGANRVLDHFQLPAIGGKDSMSGSFYYETGEVHVPPTLISFAVNTSTLDKVLGTDFKKTPSYLRFYPAYYQSDESLDLVRTEESYREFLDHRDRGKVLSAQVVEERFEKALWNMSRGNDVGFDVKKPKNCRLGILAQVREESGVILGALGSKGYLIDGKEWKIKEDDLADIFPTEKVSEKRYPVAESPVAACQRKEEVRVLLPVFPGTNCEEDMKAAFEEAGAVVETLLFTNQFGVLDSLKALEKAIENCDVLGLSGGFSAADEPEGSAKFIATVFRNEGIQRAFHALLERGGYVIGICNGFQALAKLGLFQGNRILPPSEVEMVLTFNQSGRHEARFVQTQLCRRGSDWLQQAEVGEIHSVPISHGEGRFFATEPLYRELEAEGQIFSRYLENPNGSMENVEGLISANGHILGKMAHNERVSLGAINVPNQGNLNLMKSLVMRLKGEI